MKKIFVLIIISIFLLGCNLPFAIKWNTTPTVAIETATSAETTQLTDVATEVPTESLTEIPTEAPVEPTVNETEINLGGITMDLPACLAANANFTSIDAVPYDEMSGPMEYYPANRKITFQGYPLSGKFFTVDDPSKIGGVVVYPVAEYEAMNQLVTEQVTGLQGLLASHPATPDSIPFLPTVNAAQVFRAQVKYLSFQNGQGVRFLTEYAQYYAPINNYDLFYTFQGLTADGKYWISAVFPINAAYLQASWDSTEAPAGGMLAPSFDDQNYAADFAQYYVSMIDKVNNTPDADFTPGLDCLDQYIQSLLISD